MFTFWPLFLAFIVSLFGHLVADQVEKWKIPTKAIWIVVLIAGLYLVAGAIHMAIGWEDPIGDADTSKYVHRPRDWIVIQLLRVWPFFLIAVGALAVYIAYMNMRRRKSA